MDLKMTLFYERGPVEPLKKPPDGVRHFFVRPFWHPQGRDRKFFMSECRQGRKKLSAELLMGRGTHDDSGIFGIRMRTTAGFPHHKITFIYRW
jgi:hypothetical protein